MWPHWPGNTEYLLVGTEMMGTSLAIRGMEDGQSSFPAAALGAWHASETEQTAVIGALQPVNLREAASTSVCTREYFELKTIATPKLLFSGFQITSHRRRMSNRLRLGPLKARVALLLSPFS